MTEVLWLNVLWAGTGLWAALCLLALGDSIGAIAEERQAWLYAKAVGNGRRVVAEGRYITAKWFVVGFVILSGVAGKAVLDLFYSPTPNPEAVQNLAYLRWASCGFVFAFWRAKRANRAMVKRAEAMVDVKGEVERLQDLERDTNEKAGNVERKVEKIDEKLDASHEDEDQHRIQEREHQAEGRQHHADTRQHHADEREKRANRRDEGGSV